MSSEVDEGNGDLRYEIFVFSRIKPTKGHVSRGQVLENNFVRDGTSVGREKMDTLNVCLKTIVDPPRGG